MTSVPAPLCLYCEQAYTTTFAGNTRTCIAFPEGIPDSIWLSRVDHRMPIAGDRGIQFQRDRNLTAKEERIRWGKPGSLNS